MNNNITVIKYFSWFWLDERSVNVKCLLLYLNTFGVCLTTEYKILGHHVVHWRAGAHIGALQSIINIPEIWNINTRPPPPTAHLLNTDKFWVNLSLFLVSRFRSIPSMRFSNQVIMAALLSPGWEEMIWSRRFWRVKLAERELLVILTWKYSSFNKISPKRGLDMDHWFLQSSNMMIFNTWNRSR